VVLIDDGFIAYLWRDWGFVEWGAFGQGHEEREGLVGRFREEVFAAWGVLGGEGGEESFSVPWWREGPAAFEASAFEERFGVWVRGLVRENGPVGAVLCHGAPAPASILVARFHGDAACVASIEPDDFLFFGALFALLSFESSAGEALEAMVKAKRFFLFLCEWDVTVAFLESFHRLWHERHGHVAEPCISEVAVAVKVAWSDSEECGADFLLAFGGEAFVGPHGVPHDEASFEEFCMDVESGEDSESRFWGVRDIVWGWPQGIEELTFNDEA
jgi:hypothetical protein